MTTAPAIPPWEMSALETLSSEGDLYGLNPTVLGAIDQAESSGGGGGINSSGYGGWFGLGEAQTYPGGTTTPTLLEGTDPTSFATQAEIAASEFASLLKQYGDPIKAEEAYQSGSPSGPTEGSGILSADLGTASPLSGVPNNPSMPAAATLTAQATTTGLNANPLDLFGIPAAAASGFGSDLSKIASALWGDVSKYVITLAFIGAGLALVVVGIKGLAEDHAPNIPTPPPELIAAAAP